VPSTDPFGGFGFFLSQVENGSCHPAPGLANFILSGFLLSHPPKTYLSVIFRV
jgi:hypothetical protein